jgi:hypothetical protein
MIHTEVVFGVTRHAMQCCELGPESSEYRPPVSNPFGYGLFTRPGPQCLICVFWQFPCATCQQGHGRVVTEKHVAALLRKHQRHFKGELGQQDRAELHRPKKPRPLPIYLEPETPRKPLRPPLASLTLAVAA